MRSGSSALMALPFTKDQVAEIIASVGADNLTAKKVRELLEQKLDMDSGELKQYKSEISEMIDTVMKESGDGDEDEDEEEEEEEEQPKKKAKKEPTADNPNKGKMSCATKSGDECPKNIKKEQEKMKMSIKKFLESAKALEIDVDGNTLRGEPRTFSSGAAGWYLGGKVELKIGGADVWAQVGMNVVIPGSNVWKK